MSVLSGRDVSFCSRAKSKAPAFDVISSPNIIRLGQCDSSCERPLSDRLGTVHQPDTSRYQGYSVRLPIFCSSACEYLTLASLVGACADRSLSVIIYTPLRSSSLVILAATRPIHDCMIIFQVRSRATRERQAGRKIHPKHS